MKKRYSFVTFGGSGSFVLYNGFRYDPDTDSWTLGNSRSNDELPGAGFSANVVIDGYDRAYAICGTCNGPSTNNIYHFNPNNNIEEFFNFVVPSFWRILRSQLTVDENPPTGPYTGIWGVGILYAMEDVVPTEIGNNLWGVLLSTTDSDNVLIPIWNNFHPLAVRINTYPESVDSLYVRVYDNNGQTMVEATDYNGADLSINWLLHLDAYGNPTSDYIGGIEIYQKTGDHQPVPANSLQINNISFSEINYSLPEPLIRTMDVTNPSNWTWENYGGVVQHWDEETGCYRIGLNQSIVFSANADIKPETVYYIITIDPTLPTWPDSFLMAGYYSTIYIAINGNIETNIFSASLASYGNIVFNNATIYNYMPLVISKIERRYWDYFDKSI
jgi:hypothetical protein